MKSNLKDVFLLTFAFIGLYLLFEISQNGRYVIIGDGDLLDTRNGRVYYSELKEKIVSGKPRFYWVLNYEDVKK
ncbi:hypothetical protein HME7025_00712 [Aquirufa nivalisilvae]|uniref:Uncharacterized protein n=1 Tax=Aquirufa nivalisilvae TaxID=2516557 RepID=A0A2S2DT60_9BACT|nr:hypothetical protein [Aquirufa nivalisilvae]AWL08583.1 hypothetical protein HME7025_00712 [Aquirufa nivalisilvae]